MNLEDEMINDYYVSTKQKKIWSIQLDLLNKLISVCEAHDIKCFIIWGTLLGCIRHKGFIPWDDDLDVGLLREDYDRLCKVALQEFNEPYFFQNTQSDPAFFIGYSRLRNSNTTGIIRENAIKDYNNGIYIDIYPLDGLIDDGIRRKKQFLKKEYYFWLGNAYYKNLKIKWGIKSIIYNFLHLISKCYTYETIQEKYNHICQLYNQEADRVGLVYHETLWKKYNFPKRCVEEIIMSSFEDYMVPIPKEYDEILRNIYGEYHEFPPKEKRGQWHGDNLIYDPDVSYKEYMKNDNYL